MTLQIVFLFAIGWTWGIHCLLSEGFIFQGLGKVIERMIGSYWSKPVFTCPPCMSSIHGSFIYFLFINFDLGVIPFAVCLAGANFIIVELINR